MEVIFSVVGVASIIMGGLGIAGMLSIGAAGSYALIGVGSYFAVDGLISYSISKSSYIISKSLDGKVLNKHKVVKDLRTNKSLGLYRFGEGDLLGRLVNDCHERIRLAFYRKPENKEGVYLLAKDWEDENGYILKSAEGIIDEYIRGQFVNSNQVSKRSNV